jgi:hypothetical protein
MLFTSMENPPFSIQPSIEEPFEGWQPWDQSALLPALQQRYSTAWSDRQQLSTASLVPETAARRLPASSTSLQQPPNEPSRKKKPKNLNDDDCLVIFQLTIQASDAYSHMTNKAFWEKVASSFTEATGKEHGTIGQAVEDIVKARCKVLAEDKTGEEEKATSLTDAIDQWIDIIDARKELEKERQEAQGARDAETKKSINWRNAQLIL